MKYCGKLKIKKPTILNVDCCYYCPLFEMDEYCNHPDVPENSSLNNYRSPTWSEVDIETTTHPDCPLKTGKKLLIQYKEED